MNSNHETAKTTTSAYDIISGQAYIPLIMKTHHDNDCAEGKAVFELLKNRFPRIPHQFVVNFDFASKCLNCEYESDLMMITPSKTTDDKRARLTTSITRPSDYTTASKRHQLGTDTTGEKRNHHDSKTTPPDKSDMMPMHKKKKSSIDKSLKLSSSTLHIPAKICTKP